MRRWDKPQNFCLAFIDELEKLLKKLLKWANKKCKNFNIYNVVFFVKKKNKEKHLKISLFHTCVPNIKLI